MRSACFALLLSLVLVVGGGQLFAADAAMKKRVHHHHHALHHNKKTKTAAAISPTAHPTAQAAGAKCETLTPREAGKQSVKTFYAHIKYAHMQTSPSQQVHDASNVSGYVKLHTTWLESVLAPLVTAGSGKQSCEQSSPPTSNQPSPGSSSNPQPSPSPAPSPPPNGQPTEPAGAAGPQQSASGTETVDIRDMAFHPVMLHIKRGTKVTWTNFDDQPHTVTSKDGNGPLNSPLLHKGDSWSYVFTKPGQYDYYCAVHPNMQAEVMVM